MKIISVVQMKFLVRQLLLLSIVSCTLIIELFCYSHCSEIFVMLSLPLFLFLDCFCLSRGSIGNRLSTYKVEVRSYTILPQPHSVGTHWVYC